MIDGRSTNNIKGKQEFGGVTKRTKATKMIWIAKVKKVKGDFDLQSIRNFV